MAGSQAKRAAVEKFFQEVEALEADPNTSSFSWVASDPAARKVLKAVPADWEPPFVQRLYFECLRRGGVRPELKAVKPIHYNAMAEAFGQVAKHLGTEKAGMVYEVELLILRALVLQHRRARTEASAAFAESLSLAQPGGFVRTFLDEGQGVVSLLRDATDAPATADYARRLLAASAAPGVAGALADRTGAAADLIEPLTDREMEVLALIAVGHTNREIGDQLYISQGTVKAHTSNIYGKLGVRSRTEAVARARELGIL